LAESGRLSVDFLEYGIPISQTGNWVGGHGELAYSQAAVGQSLYLLGKLDEPSPEERRIWRFYSEDPNKDPLDEFALASIANDESHSLFVGLHRRNIERGFTQSRFIYFENRVLLSLFKEWGLPYSSLLRTFERDGIYGLEKYSSSLNRPSPPLEIECVDATSGDSLLWPGESLLGGDSQRQLRHIAYLFSHIRTGHRFILITSLSLPERMQFCEALQLLLSPSNRVIRFATSNVTGQPVDLLFAYANEPYKGLEQPSGYTSHFLDEVPDLGVAEEDTLALIGSIFDPKQRGWHEAVDKWFQIYEQLDRQNPPWSPILIDEKLGRIPESPKEALRWIEDKVKYVTSEWYFPRLDSLGEDERSHFIEHAKGSRCQKIREYTLEYSLERDARPDRFMDLLEMYDEEPR